MNRKTKTSEMKVEEQLETKNYPTGPEEYIEEREIEDVIPIEETGIEPIEENKDIEFVVNSNKSQWIESEAIIFSTGNFNFCNFWFNANQVLGFSSISHNDFEELGLSEEDLISFELIPDNCSRIYLMNREEPLIIVDISPEQLLSELE
jgi:hypothetical protein